MATERQTIEFGEVVFNESVIQQEVERESAYFLSSSRFVH